MELFISCDVVIYKTSFHTNHDFTLSTNIELKFGEQNHDKQLLAEVSKIKGITRKISGNGHIVMAFDVIKSDLSS